MQNESPPVATGGLFSFYHVHMTVADQWQTLDINGKPAQAFAPSEPARGTIIFLHNAACHPLSVSTTYTQLLQEHRLNCICPWGGATWWSDRVVPDYDPALSAERYVLDVVVPFTRQHFGMGPQSFGLLGISMGGQGALRLAFKRPDLFPVVAGVAPAIEYHQYYGQGSPIDAMYTSKEQCRQDTVPMHVNPTALPRHVFFCIDPDDDHWQRGADRLHEKLLALGVAHECDLTTQAGGHGWTYDDALAKRTIEFLARGLAHESRRLL
jgi:pimeloyl-ACP methyl ester carboxylesterase